MISSLSLHIDVIVLYPIRSRQNEGRLRTTQAVGACSGLWGMATVPASPPAEMAEFIHGKILSGEFGYFLSEPPELVCTLSLDELGFE